MSNQFHSIIIGFGKGGKTLAGALAGKGLKVVLIEKSNQMYGGTCINKACIPTKSLENASSKIREEHIDNLAVQEEKYEAAIERKEALITKLRTANYNKLNSNENIRVITGIASFVDQHTVEVATDQDETLLLTAENIFINTGTKPFVPDIKGGDHKNIVLTSDDLLKLKELPQKLTIIGAGFIGLEFAGIYSSFGSEVTVINNISTILPNEDLEDAEEVKNILEKRNVRFINNAAVEEIQEKNGMAKVTYSQEGQNGEVLSDKILIATGRAPETTELHLEKAGVVVNTRGFIEVNDKLQTNVPNIWALGDVNGGPQFTYISLDDYRIVMSQLFGDNTRSTKDRKNVPSAIFLDPSFARVGLNVKQAKEKGYEVIVAKMATDMIPRAKQIGKTDGFIKIVIDQATNKILGATMICDESSEMIHLIQLAIDMELPYTYLRDRIYAHPTMTEALNEVLSPAMIKEV